MTANAATGCIGAARVDYDQFAGLCGNKMRPRNYDFYGVELRLNVRRTMGNVMTETVAGARFHHENVTRRRYNGLTPGARENSPGVVFRDWNEINADAFPVYAQTAFFTGGWTFTPGIRVERITSQNQVRRQDGAELDAKLENTQTMVLPGFGFTYSGLSRMTLFAGVHRGFAPPRPDENLNPTDPNFTPVSPERSTNYETGTSTGSLLIPTSSRLVLTVINSTDSLMCGATVCLTRRVTSTPPRSATSGGAPA